MAKVVKQFNFSGRGTPLYDWDKWFDGQIWQLTKDEDFIVSCASFRVQAQGAARKRRLRLRTKIVGDIVTMQAVEKMS